jgi:hypothetical protein
MPVLSLFTACGFFELSGRDPVPAAFYRSLIDSYGPGFDATPETESGVPNPHEARCYATALALARGQNAITRAGNQYNGSTAWDLLLGQARDWGVIPAANDTMPSLQAKIAAKQLLAKGANFTAMVAGLRAILGSSFLAYRPIATSEATAYPTWPSATALEKANPTLPLPVTKMCVLADPIGATGVPLTVAYTNLDPSGGEVDLDKGDVVMVQPELTALSEKVTVLAATKAALWSASTDYALGALLLPSATSSLYYEVVAAGTSGTSAPAFPAGIGDTVTDGTAVYECIAPTPAPRTFTGVFQNGHDVGATVTTMSWPYAWSTQHFVFIVVTPAASVDAELRREVNEFMARSTRGVGQWAIVQPQTSTPVGGTIGPFLPGHTPIGTAPIGIFPFVPSP